MPSQPSQPSASASPALLTLRTNQLSPTATAWFASVLSALDDKDLPRYLEFLSPTVRIIFNNGDMSMTGIDAAREGLGQFWQSFGTLRHEELNVYGTDERFAHEALNHYVTLDGRQVTLRAVACIDRDAEGRIAELRVYGDQSPLWGTRGDGKEGGGGGG